MWSTPPTQPLYPQERTGTHCIGGKVGSKAGLDGYGISRPHPESIPGPSSTQQFAIPTELSQRTKHVADTHQICVYNRYCVFGWY